MAETIVRGCNGANQWHWYNIMHDLEKIGGLERVTINPLSITNSFCAGETAKGTRFTMTWVYDAFLMVSVSQEEQELIDAFSKVVEYKPVCKYVDANGLLTYEWDKLNPQARLNELKTQGISEIYLL